MLSDIHINAAQTVLSRQFPELSGLQLTNYIPRDMTNFSWPQTTQFKFTTLTLFTAWAVSTSIRRPKSCRAWLLDSMSGDLSSSTQCQLAIIYGVTAMENQTPCEWRFHQYSNKLDLLTGLFTIAFATDLAFEMDPVKISY